jgi:hypothetical protein
MWLLKFMKTENNVEHVITQRLNLETNRRILSNEFGIDFTNLTKFNSKQFLNLYSTWEPSKRNKFIVIIGGRTNFSKTLNYFDTKVKGAS